MNFKYGNPGESNTDFKDLQVKGRRIVRRSTTAMSLEKYSPQKQKSNSGLSYTIF